MDAFNMKRTKNTNMIERSKTMAFNTGRVVVLGNINFLNKTYEPTKIASRKNRTTANVHRQVFQLLKVYVPSCRFPWDVFKSK